MRKKILTLFLAFALGVTALPVSAFATENVAEVQTNAVVSTGIYKGTTTANNGTVYTYELKLNEDGSYSYYVEFTMGETIYSNTETGTYTVGETTMTFTAVTSEIKEGEVYTAVINGENHFILTRLASYFSLMSGKTADIEFTLLAEEDTETDTDTEVEEDTETDTDTEVEEDTETDTDVEVAFGTLETGAYAVDLTWVPFMDAMLDPVVEIDATAKTFKIYNAAAPETLKGNGTVTFDEASEVYTLVYEEVVRSEKSTTFMYDADTDTITFTSALYYGNSNFNNTDEAGNFVPYGAVATSVYANTLENGTYAVDLTWIPFMDAMLDPIVEIDATAKTFEIYNAAAPETLKGNGTVKFDALSGVYTLVYEVEEGAEAKTTTFMYDAETDTITFTSTLYYGASSFNNTDENGTFVSYTAVLTELETDNNENTSTEDDDQNISDGNTSIEDDNQNTSDGNTNTEDDDQNTSSTSPDTGDVSFHSVWAMMVAAVAGMIFVQKRKRA